MARLWLQSFVVVFCVAISSVYGCGDCWCNLKKGQAQCPPVPQSYSKDAIATFLDKVPLNTIELDCDPYSSKTPCMTTPPLVDLGNSSVCAFKYEGDKNCSAYHINTYESYDAAVADSAFVTHTSGCGTCSTAQDLAVYMNYPDMTSSGRKCATETLASYKLGLKCYLDMGMTEACARTWMYDGAYDRTHCMKVCVKNWFTPYNVGDDCRLNDCLQCDEDNAGPIFKKFAGRTRRRSGLKSAIMRDCLDVDTIDHLACPSSPSNN